MVRPRPCARPPHPSHQSPHLCLLATAWQPLHACHHPVPGPPAGVLIGQSAATRGPASSDRKLAWALTPKATRSQVMDDKLIEIAATTNRQIAKNRLHSNIQKVYIGLASLHFLLSHYLSRSDEVHSKTKTCQLVSKPVSSKETLPSGCQGTGLPVVFSLPLADAALAVCRFGSTLTQP